MDTEGEKNKMAICFASIGISSCLRPLIFHWSVVPLNLCGEAGGLVLVRGVAQEVDLVRSVFLMATGGNSSSPNLKYHL